jgi:hypothetical protein
VQWRYGSESQYRNTNAICSDINEDNSKFCNGYWVPNCSLDKRTNPRTDEGSDEGTIECTDEGTNSDSDVNRRRFHECNIE